MGRRRAKTLEPGDRPEATRWNPRGARGSNGLQDLAIRSAVPRRRCHLTKGVFMSNRSTPLRSPDRILNVLEAFGDTRRALSLSDLAKQAGLPVSTCHSIVGALLRRGYLYFANPRKELYPTRKLLDVAQHITSHDPLLERVAPILGQLRDDTQETVIMGKRQKDIILYLDVQESPQTIRYIAYAGDRKPMHSSSIGKAVLGSLPEKELQKWLAKHPLPSITPNTLDTPERLIRDLQESRQRGYYVTRGENVADANAIAATVCVNNELLGIAVAGPAPRMEARLAEHAERLLAARRDIERRFQG